MKVLRYMMVERKSEENCTEEQEIKNHGQMNEKGGEGKDGTGRKRQRIRVNRRRGGKE